MIKKNLLKICRWCAVVILIFVLGYGGKRLYYYLTDGFTLGTITHELPYNPDWKTHPLSVEEKNLVDEALNQPYTYYSQGHQAYVFLSKDHRYVLKFMKFQRIRVHPWIVMLWLPPPLSEWRRERMEYREKEFNNVFRSWKIAFDDLKEETGLVLVHLNRTQDLNKTLEIADKLGLKHKLNMDEMVFLIQRKASMLNSTLENEIKTGNEIRAKAILQQLIDFYADEYRRGLAEKDLNLIRNTGILEGNIIHIDLGRFVKDEKLKDPKTAKQEVWKKTTRFRQWLQKYPSYLEDFENRIKKLPEE